MRTLLLAGGLIGAAALFVWSAGSERRALQGLSEPDRQALYQRTLTNLRSVCSPASDAMRGFCEEQAHLAESFPECDQACYKLAMQQLSRVQLPR